MYTEGNRSTMVRCIMFAERMGLLNRLEVNRIKRIYELVGDWEVQRYEANEAPLTIEWISPNDIKYISGRHNAGSNRFVNIGNVQGGNWDIRPPYKVDDDREQKPRLYDNYDLHTSFVEHFENDIPWEDTTRYSRIINQYDDRDQINNLQEQLEQYDKLYQQIADGGYKTQFQLKQKADFITCLLNEINVDVDRNGNPLFVENRHRLSIAKIIGLNEIPVFKLVRHESWLDNSN